MSDDSNKYYTKYNRDIKSIRGAGVITKRGPPDTNETVGTIREILDDDLEATPPLYPRTWQYDSEQTSGYLNELDYLDYVPDIDKYYYTSQQIDDIDVRRDKPTKTYIKKINNNEIIQLPPPLVTTKSKFKPDLSEYAITKTTSKEILKTDDSTKPVKSEDENIKKKKDSTNTRPDSNNNAGEDESEFGIGQSDINRDWYDGRYAYYFSPNSLKSIYPWASYSPVAPYLGSNQGLQFIQDTQQTNISSSPTQKVDNPNQDQNEFFSNIVKDSSKSNYNLDIQNINMLYLALICLLLIIYFIRNK